jgi:hypothetical protein
MNKTGATNQTIGLILTAVIAVLVGVALFLAVMQQIGSSTDAIEAGVNSANVTVTIPAASTTVDVTGQDLLSTPIVSMQPNGSVIGSGNYTIDEGVSTSTGVKTIRYTSSSDVDSGLVGLTANITMDYGPDGYIANAGARSVAAIIGIFMALGIAVVMLVPALRSGVLNMVR